MNDDQFYNFTAPREDAGFGVNYSALPTNNAAPDYNFDFSKKVGGDFGNNASGGNGAGMFQNFATGVGLATNIYGLYQGNKQIRQAKREFNFSRDFANRNLVNQSQDYNRRLRESYLAKYNNATDAGRANMQSVDEYVAENQVATDKV